MNIPSYFTVSPTQTQGTVYSTFEFKSTLPDIYTSGVWAFGDGATYYKGLTAAHKYLYPGIYTASLTAWTNNGNRIYDSADIQVDYALRDAILFSKLPIKKGFPGQITNQTFEISLTSCQIDQPLFVTIYPINSRSVPYESAVNNKWGFLTPTWKILNGTDQTILTNNCVSVSSVPLYKNSEIVAVSGQATFYYVDDLPTETEKLDRPLVLVATLSTEHFTNPTESNIYPYKSYSNSGVTQATTTWQIQDTLPTKLKVTENYINNIYPTKWAEVPIPLMVTCEFNSVLSKGYSSTSPVSGRVFSYPETNAIGQVSPLAVSLISSAGPVPSSYYKTNETPYFKAADVYGNDSKGYVFTTITPLSPINTDVRISVSTTINVPQNSSNKFNYPLGISILSNAYLSDVGSNAFKEINCSLLKNHIFEEPFNALQKKGLLLEGQIHETLVPYTTSVNRFNGHLLENAGIYGLAVSPLNNALYICDSNYGTIYKYDLTDNTLTNTFFLSSLFNSSVVPCSISIDGLGNVWVSSYDEFKVIKLNSNLSFLLSAQPTISFGTTYPLTYSVPSFIETDSLNNVWVCYTDTNQFDTGFIVKYDSSGTQQLRIDSFEYPASLAVNKDNNLWVTCKNSNKVELYSCTTGALLTSLSSMVAPQHISVDRSNNVWITHGTSSCSVYNTNTNILSTWKADINMLYPIQPGDDVVNTNTSLKIHSGLAVDVHDRVWFITNTTSNKSFVFDSTDIQNYATFNLPARCYTNGDLTGNRWYQKYKNSNYSFTVQGSSTPFTVYDANNSFNIAKVNEEFNYSSYLKSLALPEIMQQNKELFDEFFAAVVGDGNPTKEDLGRVLYERIANFVSTHADIDTAEIKNLVSWATQMAVETNTFGTNFPAEVSRLLNLFSISKDKLRGIRNIESNYENNIRSFLTENSQITAGLYYFIKDKQSDYSQIIYAVSLSGSLVYDLSGLNVKGLKQPISSNYYVFSYDNENHNGYLNNVINWDSDYTTISYSLSGDEQWYGDQGLVETMFNNLLTKRLYLE